jgi:hypothetical protein
LRKDPVAFRRFLGDSRPVTARSHRDQPSVDRNRTTSARALAWCLLLAAMGCGTEDSNTGRPPVAAGSGAAGSASNSGTGGSAGASGAPGAGANGEAGMNGGSGMTATQGGSVAPTQDAGPAPAFDAGTDPSRNRVQPGGICQRLSTLQCEGEAHCCASPGRSFDACFTRQADVCTHELQLDLIAADAVAGFDADMTAQALTHFEQMAAECDPDIAAWGASMDGLRRMLQGTVEPAGSCMPPDDIPSVAGYGAALASCAQTDTHACLFGGDAPIPLPPISATCTERGQQGAVCFVDTNCIDALYCHNPDGQYSTGTCAARKPVGASCATGVECESRFCNAGSCIERTQQSAFCLQ